MKLETRNSRKKRRFGRKCRIAAGLLVCAATLLFHGDLEAANEQALARSIVASSGRNRGLCVHLGCGEGRLTAELTKASTFLVHGLAADRTTAKKARNHLQLQGLYGRASVEFCDFKELPYADNLVNLVVIDDLRRLLKGGLSMKEVMRVLRPHGVVALGDRGGSLSDSEVNAKLAEAGIKLKSLRRWAKVVKPWPDELDHWTHFKHDGGQTKVSQDRSFGPPYGYRWLAGPVWPVNGPKMSNSNRGMISVNGIIYYVTTNVPANVKKHPQKENNRNVAYYILARDAFNGMMLWYRPLTEYEEKVGIVRDKAEEYRSTSSHATAFGHSMVTDGKHLYGVLRGTVLSIDAKTGEFARVFVKGIRGVNHFKDCLACHDGTLVIGAWRTLQVFDTGTAKLKWKLNNKGGRALVGDGKVFCVVDGQMICADIHTGKIRWQQAPKGSFEAYKSNIVLTINKKANRLDAVSAEDGRHLWSFSNNKDWKESYGMYSRWTPGAWFMKELIWVKGRVPKDKATDDKRTVLGGVNPLTGKLEKRCFTKIGSSSGVCRDGIDIATERFMITARPINFIEPDAGSAFELREGRHACALGVRVANGLVYNAPQGCRCGAYNVRGFIAIGSSRDWEKNANHPLVKGSAYGRGQRSEISDQGAAGEQRTGSEWATFRHDNQRTGSTKEQVGIDFALLWKTKITNQKPVEGALQDDWLIKLSGEAQLTAPVVADGMVFMADTDTHQMISADASTGAIRWRYTADGRIVVPPTIYKGLCLFGARDGWIYCLRAKDGELVWRLRAAPVESRIMAYSQLESPWPAVGGVLVENDVAYVIAGRSHTIGGGCWFHSIDVFTGEIKRTLQHKEYGWHPRKKCGEYSHLLVSAGGSVTTADGLLKLDPAARKKRTPGCFSAKRNVFDRSWHRLAYALKYSAVRGGAGWSDHKQIWGVSGSLVAGDTDRQRVFAYNLIGKYKRDKIPHCYLVGHENGKQLWSVDIPHPLQFEAMVLTPDVLFVAGPKDLFDRNGQGVIQARSPNDGSILKEVPVGSLPAAEGMAVAYGKLYLTTKDGNLICFGK